MKNRKSVQVQDNLAYIMEMQTFDVIEEDRDVILYVFSIQVH